MLKYYLVVRGEIMKLPNLEIIDEKDKRIRQVSHEVTFPLSSKDKQMIDDMLLYLKMSQIEEEREKYDLRAGTGLSAVQLGVLKRFFVIVDEVEQGKFKNYIVINPKVISCSEEMIFVGEGEGCLSVNRETEGIVPRHARMNVEAYDVNGNPFSIRVREDISIAFQHEIDHLNGKLFTDYIDSKEPFKNAEMMREI